MPLATGLPITPTQGYDNSGMLATVYLQLVDNIVAILPELVANWSIAFIRYLGITEMKRREDYGLITR